MATLNLPSSIAGICSSPPAPASAVGSASAQADTVANEKNKLRIEDDDTGEATIYFYSNNEAYSAEFELEWTTEDDKIILDMECQGDCSSFDFEMECTLNDDDDEMDCDGDKAFSDYEFEWKRD